MKTRKLTLALLAIAFLGGGSLGATAIPAIAFYRTTTQSSIPGVATGSHPIHWDDTSGRQRFSDGTSDRYVPACVPAAAGDICQWNGSNWVTATVGVSAPQLLTASFSAVDSVNISWSNLGGTQYVFMGVPIVTDGGGGVTLHIINKTSTGATLKASAPFTGTVAVSVVSL